MQGSNEHQNEFCSKRNLSVDSEIYNNVHDVLQCSYAKEDHWPSGWTIGQVV